MAVYTRLTREEIQEFLMEYTIGDLVAFHPIEEGIENTNYILETSTGKYILTLFENRVQEGDVPYYMALKKHLAHNFVSCPKPLDRKDGASYGHLSDRPAVIVSFLKGKGVSEVQDWQLGPLGRQLAQLHLAARGFDLERPNDLSLFGWQKIFVKVKFGLNSIESGLQAFATEEMAMLSRNWEFDIPKGVIHADLFPDNVFFDDRYLSGVIDFYFACNDFLAYDLAICINAWCFDQDGEFRFQRAQTLINAYHTIRRLQPAEISALPILLRGSAFRFLMTRCYDYLNQIPGAIVKVKDPMEYVNKLRFYRQHQTLDWLVLQNLP